MTVLDVDDLGEELWKASNTNEFGISVISIRKAREIIKAHTIDLPDLIRRDAVVPAIEDRYCSGESLAFLVEDALMDIPSWTGRDEK
jgi:hypothetical protein